MSSAFYILLYLDAFSNAVFSDILSRENNSKLIAFGGIIPNL